jgi:16S rRNA (cytosine967-C5)-methyltransferase
VLLRVERDRAYADLTLHADLQSTQLSRRDRALATEIAYGALRTRGRLDASLQQVLERKLGDLEPELRNLLRIGAYQILFLGGVRDAAAVDESVKLARLIGEARASGLVNAVLRALATRSEAGELLFPSLDEDPVEHLVQWGSLPRWLAERWVAELGAAEAAELASVLMGPAPRTVRVSPGIRRENVARRLQGRVCKYAPDGVTDLARDFLRDPGFEKGELSAQDEASQLVPLLLGAGEGDTVVDCCAAPGSKSAQLGQIVGPKGEVIALEIQESRIPLIYQNVRRLGLHNLRVLQRDSAQGFDLRGRLWFRHVLVDAPCSGLGALRRNPDARWRLRPGDIEDCAEHALQILLSASRYVEEGGALVYSVCTFTPEETDAVVTRFLDRSPEFRIDDPGPFLPASTKELIDERGALRLLPHRHRADGFFAVRFVRADAPEVPM